MGRFKDIAKSYLHAKEAEYAGYAGFNAPETDDDPYPMCSPKTMGDVARQEARYVGKGDLGQETAKVYGTLTGISQNIRTIVQAAKDTKAEREEKSRKL